LACGWVKSRGNNLLMALFSNLKIDGLEPGPRKNPLVVLLGGQFVWGLAGVFVQLLNELPNEDFFKYPDVFIAGSHIHFHRNFITEYIEQYKKTVQKYIDRKVPVIMDQYIIATMTKSSEFIFPTLYDANSSCVDKWFFFFDVI
jgi:hypothetical protein